MRSALRHLTSPATLADQAYAAIREAIIGGELRPNDKITERGLAERLAVSATPIREALRRLEQDGLVERQGPRAVQVVDLADDSVREVRLAEDALRTVAARLAATNATAEQLQRMEQILDEGDGEIERLVAGGTEGQNVSRVAVASLLKVTRRFHAELNAGCNNAVILRLLSTVDAFNLAALPTELTDELRTNGRESALARYREHRTIFDAVRAGDATRAEQLMAEHGATERYARL